MNSDAESRKRRPEANAGGEPRSISRSTSAPDAPYAPGSAQLRRVRRFNRVARMILNSPLHRVLSKRLMLISFVGRKTGKMYTTPVAYVEDEGHLLIAAGGPWRENLLSHPDVRVMLRGKSLAYRAAVITDSEEYQRQIHRMASVNPTWARRSGLEPGEDGQPTRAAIARAWARGMKMVRLDPKGTRPIGESIFG